MIMPNIAEDITTCIRPTKSTVVFNYGQTYQKLYWSTKQWEASPQVAWDPCCKLLLYLLDLYVYFQLMCKGFGVVFIG